MKVLSLFDGISCGQLALNRANIPYTEYLASEVDYYAKAVTQFWFPDTKQVGDVRGVDKVEGVDLLMGGSPCQGFSVAGKRQGLEDGRSGLVEEFIRIKHLVQPTWFLLENVPITNPITAEWLRAELGVTERKLNSNIVSAQNRLRWYWTNIPITEIRDRKIMWNGWLWERKKFFGKQQKVIFAYKFPTLMTTSGYYTVITDIEAVKRNNYDVTGFTRELTVTECEQLQTLPIGYTRMISVTQAKKVIGNGWTVDLVAEILKGIHES